MGDEEEGIPTLSALTFVDSRPLLGPLVRVLSAYRHRPTTLTECMGQAPLVSVTPNTLSPIKFLLFSQPCYSSVMLKEGICR